MRAPRTTVPLLPPASNTNISVDADKVAAKTPRGQGVPIQKSLTASRRQPSRTWQICALATCLSTQTQSARESSRPFDATCWEAQTIVTIVEPSTITIGTQSESPIGLHIACGATPYNGLRFTISAFAAGGGEVTATARPDGVNPGALIDTAAFAGTAPPGVTINPAAEAGANIFDIGIGTPVDDSDDSSTDACKSLSAGSDQDASNATSHMFPDLFTGIVARATDDSTPASVSGGSTLSFPTATQSVTNSPKMTSGARNMVALQPRVFLGWSDDTADPWAL
ncbi:hypothetical protein Q7P35_004029 [Cladosporium inversicolor]